ncbi:MULTISPECIES: DUF1801 domain-containing protein [Exiguobacterium]|uniref:DUF1801 domain-containing protein n=1 Tax=Exiguobacterium TaxID=33986 RepID=UPI000877841A|nr:MULTISPECIES: DUF1801 domain-containing protein [Exiguobacterium]TCI48327.1 DUF1801 domain-containing protein [Exiguobacterium sp. SH5S32]TCI55214.1 DUF1801 domain-containing protein [Exiguobacterium sp. SH1S4]TCI75007.1 DUF1801 domain-containing protein [Exiguobacterium sp. SH1S1]
MDYTTLVDDKRLDSFIRLIDVIDANLPDGFEKTTDGKGVHYVVPLSMYPPGYHVTPGAPLPFLSVIAQKNHVALYHMGVYADEDVLRWFEQAYAERVPTKLDMGKSCIRFKHVKHIPYDLIGELVAKMTPDEWVATYTGR